MKPRKDDGACGVDIENLIDYKGDFYNLGGILHTCRVTEP